MSACVKRLQRQLTGIDDRPSGPDLHRGPSLVDRHSGRSQSLDENGTHPTLDSGVAHRALRDNSTATLLYAEQLTHIVQRGSLAHPGAELFHIRTLENALPLRICQCKASRIQHHRETRGRPR